jgi:hypothetical protein
MAKANPWDSRNWVASAAQPITKAGKMMEGNVRMAEKTLAFVVAALIDLSPESTYKNYFSKLNRSSFVSLDMCLGVSSFGTATAPETKNLVTCSTVTFSGTTSPLRKSMVHA